MDNIMEVLLNLLMFPFDLVGASFEAFTAATGDILDLLG